MWEKLKRAWSKGPVQKAVIIATVAVALIVLYSLFR